MDGVQSRQSGKVLCKRWTVTQVSKEGWSSYQRKTGNGQFRVKGRASPNHNGASQCVSPSSSKSVRQAPLQIVLDSSSPLLLELLSLNFTGNTFSPLNDLLSSVLKTTSSVQGHFTSFPLSHAIATDSSLVCLLLVYLHSPCS